MNQGKERERKKTAADAGGMMDDDDWGDLCHSGCGCSCNGNVLSICRWRRCSHISSCTIGHNWGCSIGFNVGTVLADMSRFSAFIAGLSSCIEWAPIGSGTVTRDVPLEGLSAEQINQNHGVAYEFPTSIAFHCLGLAIASIVVWTTTLVACGCAIIGDIVAGAIWSKATTTSATWRAAWVWSWTIASQMTDQTAGIAATASGTTTNAQGRTVSLDMA